MDRIPTELWRRTFSFACTDDGGTGRSLSAVSKYVRDASDHYRYQSMALLETSRFPPFLLCY
ncbi:hypothetical protein NEOLEDRAFT_1076164 [Neolentinus lepideus HHB14362 ss-1]|uniref:F-box domain-containing protein n=1 Tax=Neolentinus lepideus HHB14362 ss-1 TaxID=1314782 RepID=A0A165NW05_9AGAM|nr:hypothetical protein NEOLEDRAFT_1076164 [Neolentinus lepideus HHB14362 ss-1]